MPLYVRSILITGPEEQVAPARKQHLEHVRTLAAAGRLRAAGEFTRGDGYLEIFEASDLYDAEATARASPLVTQGLGSWMHREWTELDP
jgi:uncharacterized protein YciI